MNKKPTAILLLHCPDQPGIISEITKFITDNKGNIVYLDQYVDTVDSMFFMRIEWELDNFLIPRDKIDEYITTLYSQRYGITFNLYFNDVKPRMAIFVSKMSHCLYDLLARWKAGEINVDIPCIVSNHEDLRYVALQFGIPYHVWRINKDHSNKAEVEAAEMKLLKEENVTFIVLARYMQIISDEMIEAYPHHIINIHHSFYERGVKIIGATSHYVTAELDAGPIIEQDVVRITHKDTPESLVLKGRDLDEPLLTDVADELRKADRVLFPGQGEARGAMEYLKARRLDEVIRDLKQPVLGICVGQQLLCRHSEEGDVDCIGVFDAEVKRFQPQRHEDKVPAMGWNSLYDLKSPLYEGFPESADQQQAAPYVYFVHSYYVPLCADTIATADYILPYSASLHKDNFYTCQFHPEKSGKVGEQILRNFMEI